MIDQIVQRGLSSGGSVYMGCLGESDDPAHPWCAMQVRSRHEKLVGQIMEQRSVDHWLPLVERRSRWSDRYVTVFEPLFRGYIFVRPSSDDLSDIVSARGAVRFVGVHHRPSPIPFTELKSVEAAICSDFAYDPYPHLYPGLTVEVTRGPIQGCRGLLTQKDKRHRLVIEVKLIGQAVVVDIEAADVERVED